MKLILAPLVFLALFSSSEISIAQNDAKLSKPLKVFILVGQSNMQGHARNHTLEHLGMRDETKTLYELLTDPDGSPAVHKSVWINSFSSNLAKKGHLTVGFGADNDKIGPEYAFGATMQKLIGEPILIVKTAWGGKSLHTNFRPPSAGEFVFSDEQLERYRREKKNIEGVKAHKKAATGKHYRLMLEHIRESLDDIESAYPNYNADLGYELAGMVWFQGWNDMVSAEVYPNRREPGGYNKYSELLSHFIRDVRRDLEAPALPFVIGVMGVGGPTSEYGEMQQRYKQVHQNFRDAMAAPADMPEFHGNVAAVLTENYWDQKLAELRAREARVSQEAKDSGKEQGFERAATRALRKKLYNEEFSEDEKLEMSKGISNLEYHYLGSATILCQVGEGFAEALYAMMTPHIESEQPK